MKYLDESARINVPLRFLQGCVTTKRKFNETMLPEEYYIGPFVIIGEGVKFGNKVIVDAYSKIGNNVIIEENSLLIYRCMIGSDAFIGKDTVIGGIVPENGFIGHRSRVFGNIVHKHFDSTMSWDHHEIPEDTPKIYNDSFVGFGSQISGKIDVGPYSYVCKGAIMTKTVPPYHIGFGINKIIHYSKWEGKLKDNPIFNK